ncbi:MAG: PQQ-binding-like beta-propeller repeat protein [Armatimonadota bacterium]
MNLVSWARLSLIPCLLLPLVGAADTYLADPWPQWQDGHNRPGRTTTVGPRTPTLAWTFQLPEFGNQQGFSKPSMDRRGRMFINGFGQVYAVDIARRANLWRTENVFMDVWHTSTADGLLIFGTAQPPLRFFVVRAETGDEVWSVATTGDFRRAAVIRDGVVYFHDGYTLFARQLSDGTLLWRQNSFRPYSNLSMDDEGRIFVTDYPQGRLHAIDSQVGSVMWTTAPLSGEVLGCLATENGLVYAETAFGNKEVYCFDARTGMQRWRVDPVGGSYLGLAIGNPAFNRLYLSDAGARWIVSLDRSAGDEIWRFPTETSIWAPPLLDTTETIYFANSGNQGTPTLAAVNPDGTLLWNRTLSAGTEGSLLLSPDGTLYVITKDRKLQAFRDPHVSAILTDFSIPQGARASGGLLALSASDDDYFEMNSQAWFLVSEANLSTLELGAHTSKQNPKMMDIKVEARINQPVGRINLALKNWLTGAWETVEAQKTRSNEDITYWKTGLDCRKYVRPDGRIELQIKTIVNVPITEATFRTFLDQVDIQIRDI